MISLSDVDDAPVAGGHILARFAQAEDRQVEAYRLRRRHEGPSFLCPVYLFGRQIIHEQRDSVNREITFS